MADKRKFNIGGVFFILLTGGITWFCFSHKSELGSLIDRTGMTKNRFYVTAEMDDLLKKNLYIYWYGETNGKDNRKLIYSPSTREEIPDSYGKNWFHVELFGEPVYTRMGFFKHPARAKHNYHLSIRQEENLLIIDWQISNWYDRLYKAGPDTVYINDLFKK